MGMSHARSVKLIAEVNALAATPLIETRTGGEAGGGARVTQLGQAVLRWYEELDAAVQQSARQKIVELEEGLQSG